jgi:hypothetical protein
MIGSSSTVCSMPYLATTMPTAKFEGPHLDSGSCYDLVASFWIVKLEIADGYARQGSVPTSVVVNHAITRTRPRNEDDLGRGQNLPVSSTWE